MNTHGSLEGVADELVRRGLPAEYAARATAELVEHRRDVADELRAKGLGADEAEAEAAQRLGEPHTLAKTIARDYQRRYFCGRWPRITFLLAPIPAFCGALFAAAWGSMRTYELVGSIGAALGVDELSLATKAMLKLVLIGGTTAALAPLILTLLFRHLARRAGCGWKWAIVSILQIAFVASLLCFHADRQRGMIYFEPAMQREAFFANDTATFLRSYFVQPSQLLQFAASLAALGVLIWFDRRKRLTILNASD